jgi:hypothetical protein
VVTETHIKVSCKKQPNKKTSNVVNRVPLGGGGVMVWASIRFGQAQLHLNAQRYHEAHGYAIHLLPSPDVSA